MRGTSDSTVKTNVLVHGGFVDGSGWEGIYKILKKDSHNVGIVQNPTTSLADDVAVTRRALAAQSGPVILVGHSCRSFTERSPERHLFRPSARGFSERSARGRQRHAHLFHQRGSICWRS